MLHDVALNNHNKPNTRNNRMNKNADNHKQNFVVRWFNGAINFLKRFKNETDREFFALPEDAQNALRDFINDSTL